MMNLEKAAQATTDYLLGFDVEASALHRADLQWAINYIGKQQPDGDAAKWFRNASNRLIDAVIDNICGPAQLMIFLCSKAMGNDSESAADHVNHCRNSRESRAGRIRRKAPRME
jgi:hypothetical protein